MDWEAWFTLLVVALCFVGLTRSRLSPDRVMLGGLALLLLSGVITPQQALSGLTNEGVVTVALLFVVAAGLRESGVVGVMVQALLRAPGSPRQLQFRLMAPVATVSALINNTPVVAMLIPALAEWARQHRFPVSQLMIPLSYGAIAGGVCSLVGTSTNLLVNGLLMRHGAEAGLGLFETAWVGLPVALVVILFVMLTGQRLLPQRHVHDSALRSSLQSSTPLRHERGWFALMTLAMMLLSVALGWLSMLQGALLAATMMLLGRCLSIVAAAQSIDWMVLLVIVASIGIGEAMLSSGAAEFVASRLVTLVSATPLGVLAMLFVVTALFTAMVTNNAAAVLMFPIAMESAERLGVDFMPFVIVIMVAASASFATPIGYQTNLMVYGPGGYHFNDFLRIGTPLTLLVGAVTLWIVPLVWPF